jgi:hypothetical protein
MGFIIALLGLAAALAGAGAVALGWPLVPLERGWTLVIAGSALASGGLVSIAIAMQIFETRRTRLAIESVLVRLSAPPKESPFVPTSPSGVPRRQGEEAHEMAQPARMPERTAPEPPRIDASEPGATGDDLQPARSFTVGETTFVVFTDGSIEARTTEGTKRFRSMEDVRAYLETSVS